MHKYKVDASTITMLMKLDYPLDLSKDPSWFEIKQWLWEQYRISVRHFSFTYRNRDETLKFNYAISGIEEWKEVMGDEEEEFISPIVCEIHGMIYAVRYLYSPISKRSGKK